MLNPTSHSRFPGLSRGSTNVLVCIAVASCLIAACSSEKPGGLGGRPPGGASPPAQPAAMTTEQAARLNVLRNEALGFLENEEVGLAEERLVELQKLLPDDPFAAQNLAVARLMRLDTIDPARAADDFTGVVAAAREAIGGLKALDGNSAVPSLLASRVSKKAGDLPRAILELKEAAAKDQSLAVVWFELYSAHKESGDSAAKPDDGGKEEGRAALKAAAERLPENLYLFTESAQMLADQKDGQLAELIERTRPLLEPFASTIKTNTRVDVLAALTTAKDAVGRGEWPIALRQIRMVSNVLKPEAVTQSDLLRVQKHPLEFLRPDFSEATRNCFPSTDEKATETAVKWVSTSPKLDSVPVKAIRAVCADLTIDGRPELVVLSEMEIAVFQRPGNSEAPASGGEAPWSLLMKETLSETAEAQPGTPLFSGLLTADLDDDVELLPSDGTKPVLLPERCHEADQDAVLFGPAGLALFENRKPADGGQRQLVRKTGVGWDDTRDVTAASLVDIDHDGDLDVIAATLTGLQVWSNRGNLTFENISARSALPPIEAVVRDVAIVDWDRDTDTDLLLATDRGLVFLENLRYGRLRTRPLGVAAGPVAAGRLAIGDFDGNGSWDVAFTTGEGLSVVRTTGIPGAEPQLLKADTIVAKPTTQGNLAGPAIEVGDYDNDGVFDLLVPFDGATQLFRGGSNAAFVAGGAIADAGIPSGVSGSWADWDQDGDLDIVGVAADGVAIIVNDGGNALPWLNLSLRAQQIKGTGQSASGRVNHTGIGSLVEIKTAGRYQQQTVLGSVTHFGLGNQAQADVARVLWTNGVPRNISHPKSNELICERQTLKGSCPYLYAWDGEKFAFYTDLLWAAPLGLKLGEDVVAGWRQWEHLKVDGERLQPKDGQYRLNITEELWEAAYFDQVQLVAVDHPTDLDVFTNEKVGPPELAAPRLHVVRERLLPVSVTSSDGRNLRPLTDSLDGQFAQAWSQKVRQGLVADSHFEFALPELTDAERVTLFLNGWVYPTDTSINVALSQNPDLPEPAPPSLWARRTGGAWEQVRPFMGFPGGKPKTIAVDLSTLTKEGYREFRVATNMEFYWDAVWYTVGSAEADQQTERGLLIQELPLVAANLHRRGVSAIVPGEGTAPEFYDYAHVLTGEHWPPMQGVFTRYGNVLPLLQKQDDELVVLGAGDEAQLVFSLPKAECPVGWKRDFVLTNIGWDKDADMNTVYGDLVEPLPFAAMTSYGHVDGEPREWSEAERAWERNYQTRPQSRVRFWNQIRLGSNKVAAATAGD